MSQLRIAEAEWKPNITGFGNPIKIIFSELGFDSNLVPLVWIQAKEPICSHHKKITIDGEVLYFTGSVSQDELDYFFARFMKI